ncbi:MAG: hypothetical protein UU08_C0006G0018 [Candidatus Uhrbacteria bacterium GW2011_GWE2_40_58]|nr:MAG: hypothetical protein UT94_C0007G0031 [Candidatus Uhrbacteria bacterium GW2011_GWF2_40_263]KKR67900.1 MAG: hypothetical protein UU08_C0006G0018 [Candidatus Uhrbacteria bacterium GW2011_GWE2_40_58]OGL92500.1 MAG: hypothetical protein A2239_01660 [Candidatus Uhrbacteria bacterium RIFOXYA2_FULL_40_9]OGL96869.1 MAG: hypothetical protein A2332_01995 [Candidatus Uhrbacteria bacterium RIFOXYB2_FULL_41_18]HBK34535.1 hypothetical protein [Candidatus Uhrbacteria bacterium]
MHHPFSQNGFTLVELLVVITIVGIITFLGIRAFSNTIPKSSLELDADRVVELIHRAQARTLSGDFNDVWGVYLTATNSTLFKGTTFVGRDPAFDETYGFSETVSASGLSEIVFEIRTGETLNTGTITLTSTESGESIHLVVNTTGRVSR